MAYVYTQIDGQRVEDSVAAAFYNLANAFRARFGMTLHVRSGTRTRAEQEYLYHLYITGQGNLAAKPGYSNHEEFGPTGPRALDVYDSGGDPGVTRAGTVRANWLRANASAYGFNPAGYNFSQIEPWHIEYTGSLDSTGTPSSGGGSWSETKKQEFLVSIGLDTGGVGNGWGPRSEAATKTFQSLVGLTADGAFGPDTTGVAQIIEAGGNRSGRKVIEVQTELARRGFDPGPLDDQWGNKTSLATYRFQRAAGLTADAQWGPNTDSAAFPPQPAKYPTGGHNAIESTRSTSDIQTALLAKGYDLGLSGVDGDYGPVTSVAVARFQEDQGLTVDGIYGPATDAKLFPTTPPPPRPDGDEDAHTPDLVLPTAADFPGWIRYEEKLDEQYVAGAATWNTTLADYYDEEYNPIEVHTHWWNTPGEGGTHDGNVGYLNRTKDVSANYVLSAGRITMTVPLNKNALTTGRRNPKAWKIENDPLITTEQGDLGYRTLGFLVYLVEKLNPALLNEPVRLHKEFNATTCSNIDPAKVRAYAEKFRTGVLDPATGLSPVVTPDPDPDPDGILVPAELAERILAADSTLSGLLAEAFD